MKTRTFVALAVNNEIRAGAALAVDRLQAVAPSFRWVAEENLHYTLHFLGDLTDTEVVETCDAVAAAAAEVAPFQLFAQGVGAFPSIDRPRTLWIGAGQGGESVARLHALLDQSFADLGFRGENRPYVPHLTIGKLPRQSRAPAGSLQDELSTLQDLDAGQMQVEEVTVFASQLRREGPEYHVLARTPLVG